MPVSACGVPRLCPWGALLGLDDLQERVAARTLGEYVPGRDQLTESRSQRDEVVLADGCSAKNNHSVIMESISQGSRNGSEGVLVRRLHHGDKGRHHDNQFNAWAGGRGPSIIAEGGLDVTLL